MNGFVPALVAVLLAEWGPRAALIWQGPQRERSLWGVAALVFAAGAAGTLVGPMLTGWAEALMVGIALIFAAIGQLQRVKPVTATWRRLWTFWSGGTPLIVFALAAPFGALAASFGALAGLGLAVALTLGAFDAKIGERPLRLASALILFVVGAGAAVGGLRLV